MASHLLKKLYNVTVYTIGIGVLLAATLATLVRVLLPDVGMYRSEVEAWVSNFMELPVVIHSMKADWEGWTPHLYLEQIDLLNKTGTEPIINFEKANISIDLFASLLRRQIIPQELIITGLDIAVTRLEDGSIDIEGLQMGSYRPQGAADDELGNWFFSQSLIELQQANIEWLDLKHDQPPLRLRNVSLILNSDGRRLQLEGSTSLPADYGTNMNFAIDVTGNLLSSDWSADVYLEANDILPDNWYRQFWPDELMLSGGNASIALWSTLKRAKIDSFHGHLYYSDVTILTEEKPVIGINRFATEFSGRQQTDGTWFLDMHIGELSTDNSVWPETDLSFQIKDLNNPETTSLDLYFSYLNLKDLGGIVSSLPSIPDRVLEYINLNSTTGDVNEGQIRFDAEALPDNRLQYDFRVSDFRPGMLKSDPEIMSLSGRITGTLSNGVINFTDDIAHVRHFRGQDTLTLNGSVKWNINDHGLSISSENLRLSNEHVTSVFSGMFRKKDEGGFIDAMIEVAADDIQDVADFMPYAPKFRTRDWIARSIPAGKLDRFTLLVRGNPEDFPFDNNEGRFQATASISNAVLKYSDRYPTVDGINARLTMHGRKMQIDVTQGSIFDAVMNSAKATIPDIFVIEKDLNINGQISGHINDLKSFISNSPLNNNLMLARVNETLSPSGNMQLDLDLYIPLKNPDKQLGVNGRLQFKDAEIESPQIRLELTGLNGEIRFTESSVTANGLDAMLGNEEVTLSIRGSKDDSSDPPARISISGNTSPDFIAKQVLAHFPDLSELTNRLTRELNGSTRWEASLTYTGKPDGTGLNRSLQVRSDLIGMTVTLPEPFSKKGYERTVFELNKNLDADGPQTLSLTYGDVKSEISFSEKEHSRVDRVNIHIGDKGPEIMSGPGPGIYLSGRLERLNINEWTRLLPEEFLSDNLTERLKIRTDLEIGSFELLGQTFSDTVIVAERNNDILNFTVNSPDINGKIILAELQDKERHFILDLDLLTLKKTSEGNGIGRINPARLPAMLVKVKSFKYDELDLGAFNMTAVPTANGLLFENVSFNKPDLDIQANGKWNNNRYTGSASNFFINVHTGEFNLLLETFGFINETIAKAPTRLTINANWPGSPMNFSLAKLNGNITLNMDKGQLLDIQPAAGRLFGLLSLQTLPRRMVLDFSDLFGAGMAFDSISGNFNVKDGNAYTDNLSMKGPSVDIDIRGRTGLSVKDYDQKATVTPQISDSLAVASGFFGPVGIGLGTVLYLAGNMFEPLSDSINKIMKIEYNIKGSWDNPVVEKVTVNQDS